MSEISLRDYFAKLGSLLNASAADEVIHHCRHILQYYPKNVDSYRFLGRALLLNGRWDEAAAALRRVLSVVPDDFHAHYGLSEIFDHRQKGDDAIWHMERAFEQNPNSRELLDSLRSLYRRYRNVDQAKIQLTAAAVARQALRNGNYEQALETLRDALERQPDRVDLRLLLAQALWDSGDHVEAAESALDVLQELPDCLEANRMLTALWLEEERPSDAQRYLNRVEAIDPYLAVELAQGQPPADDAFRLEESDYERSLQTELTENNPDWLQDISAAPQTDAAAQADDWSGFMSSMLSSSASEPQEEKPSVRSDLFAEDWMQLPQQPSSEPEAADEDEIPAEFAALPAQTEDDDLTLLSAFAAPSDTSEATEAEDALSWLQQSPPDLFDEPTGEPIPVEDDDEAFNIQEQDSMAWLRDDLLNDEAREERSKQDKEAPSWMQGHDVNVIEDSSPLAEPEMSLFDDTAPEEETALQWLQDQDALEEALGIEQLTGEEEELPDWLNHPATEPEPEPQADELPASEVPPSLPGTAPLVPNLFDEPTTEDSTWLNDVSETDTQAVPGPRKGLTALLNEADFDWLKSQETQEDTTSDAVMDEWLAQFGAESKPAAAEDPDWLNELDTAMNDKNNLPDSSDETPEWLSASGSEAEPETPVPEEELDWLNAAPSDAEAQPAELPDWMADLQPTQITEAPASSNGEEADIADEFDWSASEAGEEAIPADIPDWLTQLEPASEEESDAVSAEPTAEVDIEEEWYATEQSAVVADQTDADMWLDQAAIEEEAELAGITDQPAAEEETPDWLAELGLPRQETSAEAEPAAASAETFDWDDEFEIEAEAAETAETAPEAVPSGDAPAWLTELQSQYSQHDEAAQPETSAAEIGSEAWLGELEIEAEAAAEVEPETAAVSEVPDWLSELQPEQQEEPLTEAMSEQPAEVGDVDWLNQLDAEEFATSEEQQPEAEAWLAELPQTEAAPQGEAEPIIEAGDVEWLNVVEQDAEVEAETEEAVAEGDAVLPAWLTELEPEQSDQVDAVEPVTEPVAAEQQDDYGWLDEVTPESEPVTAAETVAVEEEFTWLNEVSPDTVEPETQVPEAEEEPVTFAGTSEVPETDEEFEFAEESQPDADLVPSYALAEDADDEDDYWLNEQTQDTDDDIIGEPFEEDAITEPEGMTTLPADELESDEEAFEPVPASNAPDWLNAMVPGLDVDYEASEDEPIETEFLSEEEQDEEQREFGWVEDIVEEESRQMEPVAAETPRRRFTFSRPPAWLSKLGRSSQTAKRDDELPDWPSDEPEWQR